MHDHITNTPTHPPPKANSPLYALNKRLIWSRADLHKGTKVSASAQNYILIIQPVGSHYMDTKD